MKCNTVKLPGGGMAIICTRGQSRKLRCSSCSGVGNWLCDFPIERAGKATTCDRPICHRCTTRISGDRDLCRAHAPLWDNVADKPLVGPAARKARG